MPAPQIFAVLAGALSVLLNFSMLTGTIAGILLTYLTPLPLFMAGLAFGLPGALTACASGAVLLAIAGTVFGGGLMFTLHYIGVFVVPVCLLVRQALFSRPTGDGGTEWYPAGLLVTWLIGLAAAYASLALVVTLIVAGDPLPLLRAFVERLFSTMAVQTEPETVDLFAGSLPPTIAVSWIITTIVNGCLAQGLLVRLGRNLRPSPAYADLDLPTALFFLLPVALLASFLPGNAGLAGKTLATIAAVPYFLLGLGAIHRWVRQWPWGLIVLVAVYASIPVLFPLTALAIVGIGLFVHANQLRRRRDGGGRKEE